MNALVVRASGSLRVSPLMPALLSRRLCGKTRARRAGSGDCGEECAAAGVESGWGGPIDCWDGCAAPTWGCGHGVAVCGARNGAKGRTGARHYSRALLADNAMRSDRVIQVRRVTWLRRRIPSMWNISRGKFQTPRAVCASNVCAGPRAPFGKYIIYVWVGVTLAILREMRDVCCWLCRYT